ncbi:PPOX class F420-dependent oxidoreductase [Nocardia transvalensis]|uniref:PPOX class F420-dependent oxidoreductase n=1 Tax=Nocardia transvalensis TaxID=37333 RepID=UPI00189463FF|nr:PPOX class F420-dependent oxidoreductase [Nocardia transvalensis]MBF6330521.1 PPOX class F420-dependent oxidoreductase [Nocardia transvalensis]
MAQLDAAARELLSRPIYGWVTTIRPDGSLHNTMVALEIDGDDILISATVGSAKERHVRRDPRAAVSVVDPSNPFHYVSISGNARLEHQGVDAVLDRLAEKYDVEKAQDPPGSQRVTIRITPDHVLRLG